MITCPQIHRLPVFQHRYLWTQSITNYSIAESFVEVNEDSGAVTVEEYQARAKRYDKQLQDTIGVAPESLSTEEKMAVLREYREAQYELLLDAVYKRRGWDGNSIPMVEKLKEMNMDLPEVVAVVETAQNELVLA